MPSYQRFSELISEVEVPSETRSRSVMAAMAVFDELHSSTDNSAPHNSVDEQVPRTTPTAVPLARRRSGGRSFCGWWSGPALAAFQDDKTASNSQAAPSPKLAPANADVPAAAATSNTGIPRQRWLHRQMPLLQPKRCCRLVRRGDRCWRTG